jgi:hypothetical protein
MRSLALLSLAVALMAGAATRPVAAQEAPALETVLHRAGAYLERFSQEISGVVMEEDYVQQLRLRMVTSRHLRSDFMVVADTDQGLVELRDVFEVDGKPVRDRDDRLARLFGGRQRNVMDQARRITAESSRFNLNGEGVDISRTLNLPMAALVFLRTNNLSRSVFRFDGQTTVHDRRVRVVRFRETAMPRLIGSYTNYPAEGTFWIDPETGLVAATELLFTSGRGNAQVAASFHVTYAPSAGSTSWLPKQMDEHYDVRGPGITGATLDSVAKYSNVRHFNVSVEEQSRP